MKLIPLVSTLVLSTALFACATKSPPAETPQVGFQFVLVNDGTVRQEKSYQNPFPNEYMLGAENHISLTFDDRRGRGLLRFTMVRLPTAPGAENSAQATFHKEYCSNIIPLQEEKRLVCTKRTDLPSEASPTRTVVMEPGNTYRFVASEGNYVEVSFIQEVKLGM